MHTARSNVQSLNFIIVSIFRAHNDLRHRFSMSLNSAASFSTVRPGTIRVGRASFTFTAEAEVREEDLDLELDLATMVQPSSAIFLEH
jgi:hypothetical protein